MAKPNKWVILRNRAIWILILLLVPSFVLFFHSNPGGQGGSAGKIFGQSVLSETIRTRRAWAHSKLGPEVSKLPSGFLEPLLEQQVWRELLLLTEAKRQRLRVTDAQVAELIQKVPAFQKNGTFQPDYYRNYLRAIGTTPQHFEGLLREDLLIDRLVSSVKQAVTVTDADVTAAYDTAYERLRGTLIVFDPASYTTEVTAALTEEAIRAEYEAHPEAVRVPEQVAVDYAGMTKEELGAHQAPTDEELTAHYQEHQAEWTKEDGSPKPLEEVKDHVRQQVVAASVRKQLTALALDLEEDVKAKRSFEEIVTARALTRHAAGPLSIDNPLAPGAPEPALLEAVKTLAEGEMSGVVETDLGVYVARVTQRISPRVPPLEEVREPIRERLITVRSREAAKRAAEEFLATLKERRAAGLRVEEILLTAGGPVPTPVTFTRKGPIDPLGEVAAINEAAFTIPLGELTNVLEAPTGFVILRAEERLPADPAKFAALNATVREETLTQKQNERFQEWFKALEARAKVQKVSEPTT